MKITNARLVGRGPGVFDVEIKDGVVETIELVGSISSSSFALPTVSQPPPSDNVGSAVDKAQETSAAVDTSPRASDLDLDLQGRHFLAPSLMDNHVHFKWWAMSESRTDLSACISAAEVLEVMRGVLRRKRTEEEEGSRVLGVGGVRGGRGKSGVDWVVGQHMRMSAWPDLPSLNKAALDGLVREVYTEVDTGTKTKEDDRQDQDGDHDEDTGEGERQVGLVLIFNGFHSLVCNTTALRSFKHLLPVHTDLEGHSGHLQETEAFGALEVVNTMDDETVDAMVMRASRISAALGVTEVVDLEMAWNMIDWQRRIRAGNDLLRIHAGLYAPHLDDAIERGLRTGDVVEGTQGLVKVGPHKIITDGSLGSRTAFCHHPYPGTQDFGEWVYEDETLKGMALKATRNGFKLAVHALGDKAISKTLEVLESLPVKLLAGSSIEHAQLLRMEDTNVFKQLGLIASVQPSHMIDDRPLCHTFWPGREERAFAYRSMVDAGIPLRLGSDCPVAPLQPWEAMAVAVGRTEKGHEQEPWHKEQAIDVRTAWRATTWSGKDTIEVGDPADLIVIDKDPLGCDAAGLRAVKVWGTMLGGRWTFDELDGMTRA